ncbi:uncharacterized mitochondrial protein AtMg00810-like [Hibiscus syriacus]|uniref:uncharacterized mitochondrial protein AtMg00810-like n=1 Tax=Hibiscus syriacus TaxID=106335 RepID=UPI0019250B57|nr:uncharacterized mitochondrial protein AtMg00810-like [Hibiscus syriacus]
MRLTEALVTTGYVQSKFDYSLFTKRKGTKIVIMLIYVDDLMITGNDAAMIEELKKILHASFRMKDLGELKYFLGFEILRSREEILLNQMKYALELIEEIGLGGAKPVCTPMEQNIKLTTAGYDSSLIKNGGKKIDDEVLQGEKEIYQRLIGRLIYLTHTRSDITFVVHHLSQFMQQPKRSHLEAALRVVKYIKKNPSQGILLSSAGQCQLSTFCDADWAACLMTRKLVTGFCVKLRNSLISWKSKKQNIIARSSAEAEYKGMAMVAAEIVWLKGLLVELSVRDLQPAKLYCDSKAAL